MPKAKQGRETRVAQPIPAHAPHHRLLGCRLSSQTKSMASEHTYKTKAMQSEANAERYNVGLGIDSKAEPSACMRHPCFYGRKLLAARVGQRNGIRAIPPPLALWLPR